MSMKPQELLERVEAFTGHNISGALSAAFENKLPHFMYFSHYDRMDGQIRLERVASAGAYTR